MQETRISHNHLPRTRKDSFLTLLGRKIHFFQNYNKLELKSAFQLRAAYGGFEVVSKFFPNDVAHVLRVETHRN